MIMSFSPLVAIVFLRPLTSVERVKSEPVRCVSQHVVTGKTKLCCTALAALSRYWDPSCLGLKVLVRLPAALGIAQLGPRHGDGGPSFSSRQRLCKLSR